ncbi:MAG: M23 family metallopeptidase [Candidatus Dormibacteria bacterium]
MRAASRRRRWSAAAAAGVALPLLLACWTASAAAALGTSAASSSATSSSPTPCPLSVVGGCSVLGTPSASSAPSGSSGSSPTPTGTSAGGGTPAPRSNGSGGAPPPAAAAAAAGVPGASAAAAATSIQPPALLGLLSVLNAPANVGVERPLLHHFNLADDGGAPPPTRLASAPRGTGSVPATPSKGVGVVLLLLSALAGGAAALAAARRFAIVDQRRRILAAMPLVGVALVGALLAGAKPAPALAVAAPHHTTPAVVVAQHHPDLIVAPVFQKLDAIETDMTSVSHRLLLIAGAPTSDSGRQPSLGVIRGPEQQRLAEQLTTQYENDLQSEYTFYTAVVADQTQRTQLLAAVATAPPPVADAVTYNVTAVQAMLQQEAAIAAAQAAAQTVRGPAPTSLLAPEGGAITQGFGPTDVSIEPPLTFGGVTYPHFHTGIDIANVLDTPIHAAADGVVVIAGSSLDAKGNLIGYGNYIVLQHAGKMITLYAHLDKLLVTPGQVVKRGDVIGLEGSTGYSTGPHLHFEVRIAGLLADPLTYLGTQLRGPVA